MRIINTTKWNTDDLRKLFSRAKYEVDKTEKNPKNCRVMIRNGKTGYWIGGGAWIGYNRIGLTIGKQKDFSIEKDKQDLAYIFTHEYAHIVMNNDYIDRRNYKNDWTKKMDYSWTKDYQIKEKEIKPKAQIDIQQIRYDRAMANLSKAETRLKRAKKLYKKWQNKVKYYEIVFASRKQ